MTKKKYRRNTSFLKKFHSSRGKAEVSIILFFVAVIGALFLSGGFFNDRKNPYITPTPTIDFGAPTASSACCDSGDGSECKPIETNKITYKGADYGLLKSSVKFVEGVYHLQDSGETTGDDKKPIVIINTEEFNVAAHPDLPQCAGGDTLSTAGNLQGTFFGQPFTSKHGCLTIPKAQIIYVCKKNCYASPASAGPLCNSQTHINLGLTCYGDTTSEYDAYFRLSDYPSPGIPDPIKNCSKQTTTDNGILNRQQLIPLSNTTGNNLQLNSFRVVDPSPVVDSAEWLSPWCKPAIYLYPEKKTDLTVQIKPEGKLTITIPKYPKDGWKVTAYPNGQITSNNATYSYLYYEAELPDSAYQKPTEGFVFSKKTLSSDLDSLLKTLGLNTKERSEFIEYWGKALPQLDYYFVGIIPTTTLDAISPLTFSQTPKTVIRVTLYFEALDKKISVSPPTISTPTRNGFTVVEWGGIFKRDKDHPFSCYM